MKVLLTGATGFLGFRTLEQLINDHEIDQIIAAGRKLKPTHTISHPKVIYKLGDLNDEDYVNNSVKGIQVIIHAAALSSPWGKPEQFIDANLNSQKMLIKFAKKNQVQRFIFISTPSLYFQQKDQFNIKENDPLPKEFVNHYAKTKRLAEIELENSGLPFIIFRPRALIGRGDTVIMPRLIRAFDEGKLKIIGSGKNIVDLTSVENVVHAISLAISAEEKAMNQFYNISNGQPVLLWEVIRSILAKLDRELDDKKLPVGIVKTVAGFMELKSKLTNMKEPALTKYGVGTLARSFTMDISKAQNLLGYKPQTSIEESIDNFIKWYNEKG